MISLAAMGRDWLALGVAAYGALVATCVGAYQFVRDRAGLKLVLSPVSSVTDETPKPVELWGIRVVNHRKRAITVQDVGLLLKGGPHLHGLYVDLRGERVPEPFPAALSDGEALEVYVRRTEPISRVAGAWARDALNRPYESRYPSRNPRARWRAWQNKRVIDELIKEREARVARSAAASP